MSKAEFKVDIKILGHIINQFEKKMDPEKIAIIKNCPKKSGIYNVLWVNLIFIGDLLKTLLKNKFL